MESKEKIVLGAAVALVFYTLALTVFGPVVLSAVTSNKTLTNSGSVTGVGVGIYSDLACTNPVSSINWGTIDPGSNVNKTIYVKNEGNTAVTLSIATSNWNPAIASSYLTLTWDYGGQTLTANQVLRTRLTLTASSSITGVTNFSFDITITASA